MPHIVRNLMLGVPLAAAPAVVVAAVPVYAYGPTACTATVAVSPNPITLGQAFDVSIGGTCTNQTFSVQIHSTAVTLGSETTGASGAGSGSFTAPTSLGDGTHTITVTDVANGVSASVVVTAIGGAAATPGAASTGGGPLPLTGSNAAGIAGVGAAAVAAGGGLVLASRRRRSAKFG